LISIFDIVSAVSSVNYTGSENSI